MHITKRHNRAANGSFTFQTASAKVAV